MVVLSITWTRAGEREDAGDVVQAAAVVVGRAGRRACGDLELEQRGQPCIGSPGALEAARAISRPVMRPSRSSGVMLAAGRDEELGRVGGDADEEAAVHVEPLGAALDRDVALRRVLERAAADDPEHERLGARS